MREVLDGTPRSSSARARRSGAPASTPIERPIRGGTDGSRLSFMGLPTPNLFAGEHNFHSRLEWVSVQDMEKAVEMIVNLCRVWEERTGGRVSIRSISPNPFTCSVKFTVTVMMTGTGDVVEQRRLRTATASRRRARPGPAAAGRAARCALDDIAGGVDGGLE